jgi:hypothetical protein
MQGPYTPKFAINFSTKENICNHFENKNHIIAIDWELNNQFMVLNFFSD